MQDNQNFWGCKDKGKKDDVDFLLFIFAVQARLLEKVCVIVKINSINNMNGIKLVEITTKIKKFKINTF